jgi:ABC-type multidrug transport system fused ATPase/permease subunit
MHAGRLVAQGTPQELALTCREYQRLTAVQAGSTEGAFPQSIEAA